MKKLFVAALLASAPALSQAAPNLVVNGSFESPAQATGTYGFYSTFPGPGILGWFTPEVEVRNNVVGAAQDGNNFVELDSHSNSWIGQSVATIIGQVYNLSFWYSPRAGVGADSNGISLYLDNDLEVSLTGNGINHTGNVWSNYSTTFTATSGSTSLLFAAVGNSDSLGGSLDNVSVTAVPEPETYAMLLGGLVLVGFGSRRRSEKPTA